ncbi:biotin/lipoyl-containing protein [Klebsiella oxytoca]|nr:biotin/lipoyl-containing protein [Klebsiella oxytoca]WKM72834.1 biotin/lipoyl-containing protein [Klebsiella oxytoca]
MVRYELQRLPGAPLQRGTVDSGTTLISLLDSLQLHRDLVVKLNGRALPDDYDISRPLCTGDVVAVFDQPEGGVGKLVTTILRPVSKILSGALKVFGLSNKPSASVSVATGESPNNDLTGQTNRARLYKGRPNIYGQCRVFPDLIQEALFEFVDNNKQLTEWFEVGYGRYTISSIRYSESNLGSLAGASSAIYNPGDVIGTIEVGYQFDDVDNETVPGLNESQDFPAQTATTTAPTSVAIESNQLKAVVLSNDHNFAYFAALAMPHPVTFVINATWNDSGTSVTRNVTGAGNIISSESFIGDDTLSYTTFYIGELSGEITSLPGDAVINPTLFTLNDQTPLVIGPSVSPIVSTQVWVHVLVEDLGFIPLVTPTSQIVGTQAVLNVLTGERYKTIAKETAGILKGEYGHTPVPVNAALQARVLDGAEAITCRPADLLKPELAQLEADVKRQAQEKGIVLAENAIDDVLTVALFPQPGLKFLENRNNPAAFEPLPQAEAAQPAPAPVKAAASGVYTVEVEGKAFVVKVSDGGDISQLTAAAPAASSAPAQAAAPAGAGTPVTAPLAGTIWKVIAAEGQTVAEGDVLLILEAMKMETEIRAAQAGTVRGIAVKSGDAVAVGDTLLSLA